MKSKTVNKLLNGFVLILINFSFSSSFFATKRMLMLHQDKHASDVCEKLRDRNEYFS